MQTTDFVKELERSMNRKWIRTAWPLAVAGLLAVLGARPAAAQTPEGTTIRNIASVTFTDANSNAYAAVADTVDVTVGFVAGVSVAAGAPSVTPASPSNDNTMSFTVDNIGNGTDALVISDSITTAGVITNVRWVYNTVTYTSLADLNTQLALDSITQGSSVTIDVLYNVPSGQGGATTDYVLTATSGRDSGQADTATTTVNPTETFGVAVTPDGAQNLQHLPTNAAPAYTFTFTVANNGNGAEDFDLLASNPGTAISIVSVDGVAGSSATISALAAGASTDIVVEYTIADVAAGTADTLRLEATAVGDTTVNDTGYADVEVVRPTLAITKQAWLGDRSAQISGDVLPNDFIEYRVDVTNTGDAEATTVVVTDALPAQVTYVSNEDPNGDWASINEAGGTVTATLTGTLAAAGGSAFFWIRVQVN